MINAGMAPGLARYAVVRQRRRACARGVFVLGEAWGA
jgi:hypothetical protein